MHIRKDKYKGDKERRRKKPKKELSGAKQG
jgi:hypothetical protein